MIKRFISVILTACMVIGVLPFMGVSVSAVSFTAYNQLIVNGALYTDPFNKDYGDGSTWTWNHEKLELELSGYNGGTICSTFDNTHEFKVVLAEDSTNKITADAGQPGLGCFIDGNNPNIFTSLYLEGNGKLEITKNYTKFDSGKIPYACIFNVGDIYVKDADVSFITDCSSGIVSNYNSVFISGNASFTGDTYDWCFAAQKSMEINGDVNIDMALAGNHGDDLSNVCIYSNSDNIEIKGNANIDITCTGIGIYAVGAKVIIRSNGTININADICGIRSRNSVSISGKNDININNTRYAIRADVDVISISGSGDINISLDKPGAEASVQYSCCGISARNDIVLSRDGNIKIESNSETNGSGIESICGGITILNNVNVDIDVTGYGLDCRDNDSHLYFEGQNSNLYINSDSRAFANTLEEYVQGNSIKEYIQTGTANDKQLSICYGAYSIVVNDASSDYSRAMEGDKITLYADKASEGYLFDKWTVVSGGITLADSKNAVTTFTMPAKDVEVTALYVAIETPTPTPTATVTPTSTPTPTVVPTQAPVKKLDVGDFVNRCYTVALGREADSEGYKYWVDSLNNGKACGAQVGFGFIFSGEYLNKEVTNEQYVKDLYSMFFGREADKDGFSYWVDLLNSGVDRMAIFAGFANSTEFYNLCTKYEVVAGTYVTNVSNESQGGVNCFVARLYRICLDRLPDQGGQSGWVNKLISGQSTGSSVAYGFVFSPEFINKGLSNEDFVRYMYRAFFNREADEAGFNSWVNELNNGASHETVFNGFAGSAEFINLCSEYQIIA